MQVYIYRQQNNRTTKAQVFGVVSAAEFLVSYLTSRHPFG